MTNTLLVILILMLFIVFWEDLFDFTITVLMFFLFGVILFVAVVGLGIKEVFQLVKRQR